MNLTPQSAAPALASVILNHSNKRKGLSPARNAVVLCVLILVVCAVPFMSAQAAPGDLDPTFGGDGKVTTAFTDDQDIAFATFVQPDGKIILVGYVTRGPENSFGVAGAGGGGGLPPDTDFALSRYNPDGSLDASFGGDGKVTTDFFGGLDEARAVAVRQDGKIVVAGLATNGGINGLGMARYNPDGSLDTSFGVGGKVTDFAAIGEAGALLIQPDGRIVVAGGRIARFTSDGELDRLFDITSPTSNIYVHAIALQADGKIVGAGTGVIGPTNTSFGLVRYNPDGTFDTTFGFLGKVFTDLTPNFDTANAVVIQPDGKILAGGSAVTVNRPSSNPTPFIYIPAFFNQDLAMVRYNGNGSPDLTFGSGGAVFADFFDQFFPPPQGLDTAQQDEGYALALRRDGKIVLVGGAYVWTGIHNINAVQFALARFNADGSADTFFGGDGRITTTVGFHSAARAATLQRDGKLVVAGFAATDHQRDFALVRYLDDVAPDFEGALRRYVPVLKFNTGENFFPLSVEAITDNSGNKLQRLLFANHFLTIAKSPPSGKWPVLDIGFLKDVYPINLRANEEDAIEEIGGTGRYIVDAFRFQSDRRYADRIYGRIYYGTDAQGRQMAWLQYWFFYYYNDYHHDTLTGTRRFDLHEGDWEMIQIRLDATAQPESAFYAQHDSGSQCRWSDVEKGSVGERPVVYVARSSHASYFRRGNHPISLFGVQIGLDSADGAVLRPEPTLVEINDRGPDWVNWRGRWGGTLKREVVGVSLPFDGNSPRGPKFQGEKWTDPLAFSLSKDPSFRCQ